MQDYKIDKSILIKYKYKVIKKSKRFVVETKKNSVKVSRWPLKFGLQILENGYIYQEQLEVLRRLLKRVFRKKKNLFRICIFPDKPFTRKSKNARMGRGKGNLKGYLFKGRKGRILLEFYSFIGSYQTKTILRNMVSRMPVRCQIKVLPTTFYRADWKEYF